MNCLSKIYDKKYDKLKINLLKQKAILLPPKHKTIKHFKEDFNYQNKYEFIFEDRFNNSYKIFIDVRRAFRHFTENTYNEFRSHINASLKLILTEPLFVITENSSYDKLIFYKSFYKYNEEKQKEFLHIISLSIERENENFYRYKTTYEVSNMSKLKKWILLPNNLILYCVEF